MRKRKDYKVVTMKLNRSEIFKIYFALDLEIVQGKIHESRKIEYNRLRYKIGKKLDIMKGN